MLVFLLSSPVLQAQRKWKANASLSLGGDFKKAPIDETYHNALNELRAGFQYTGKKFTLSGNFIGAAIQQFVTEGGVTMDVEGEQDVELKVDASGKLTNTWNLGTAWDASILLNERNSLNIHYQIRYSNDRPGKSVVSTSLSETGLGQLSFSSEATRNRRINNVFWVSWPHRFAKEGRMLTTQFQVDMGSENKVTEMWVGKISSSMEPETDRDYKVTPLNLDEELRLSSLFSDPSFLGLNHLDAQFQMTFRLKGDRDHLRAANLVGEEWIDSLRYREDFRFQSLTISPEMQFAYNPGRWTFVLSYTPEYYVRKLSNRTFSGGFRDGQFSHIIGLRANLTLSERHRLTVNYQRSISRPEYLQICWFRRIGGFSDEIIQGNPLLKPSLRHRAVLGYGAGKGNFEGNIEIGYFYDTRKIEKTFWNDVIDDRQYRIVSWVNAGKSHTGNVAVSGVLRMNHFSARCGGNLNFFYGFDMNDYLTKSSDYSLYSNLSYNLKSWNFTCRLRYQSKIIRSYSSMTSVIGCDVRVEKKFKHLEAFIEGRDLLDRTVTTMTISDENTHGRVDVVEPYKRLLMVGVGWTL